MAEAKDSTHPNKQKITISIESELIQELRVMASVLPPVLFPSISGAIVDATRQLIQKMRRDHNGGNPFTSESTPIVRTGRRSGS